MSRNIDRLVKCQLRETEIIRTVFSPCTLYRFRKQHEQLQAVIVRVLRPTAIQTGQGGEQGDAIETDDLSAVREVRLAYENVKVVDCLDLTPEGNAAWEASLKR